MEDHSSDLMATSIGAHVGRRKDDNFTAREEGGALARGDSAVPKQSEESDGTEATSGGTKIQHASLVARPGRYFVRSILQLGKLP